MTHKISGEGNPTARIMLVGEAPGATEERLGRPFVGQAGHLLDALLLEAGLTRNDLWVTNVVKERPTTDGRNRSPTAAEIRRWLPELETEIRTTRPLVIVCLGAVAARAVIDRHFSLSRQRGAPFPSPFGPVALATWHPAFLLRQVGETRQRRLQEAVTDLRHARELASVAPRPYP